MSAGEGTGLGDEVVGVYVHVPFCSSKCAYCDFVSYPGLRDRHGRYLEAVSREVSLQRRGRMSSVYVGGGTPTVLPAEELARLLAVLRDHFEVDDAAEVSVEANPEGLSRDKLEKLHGAGFNRLSLGLQSLDPDVLSVLGRSHSPAQGLEAYGAARDAGFENVAVDLIYGVPGQSMESWQATLAGVIDLDPEHVSAYCLSVEEGTALQRRILSGDLSLDEDLAAEMMRRTSDVMTGAGYEHYEISNFARPGRRCAHNVDCWRYHDYLGLGAAAHSKLGSARFANTPDVDAYIAAFSCSGEGTDERRGPGGRGRGDARVWEEELSARDKVSEETMLGLRMLEGMGREHMEELWASTGEDLSHSLRDLEERGLIECGDNVRLTKQGLLFANEAIVSLLVS